MTTRTEGHHDGHGSGALAAADWLGLMAAPSFAAMTLLAAVLDGGAPVVLCTTTPGTVPMSGMVVMYLLMSAFHLPPWLRLLAARQGREHRA